MSYKSQQRYRQMKNAQLYGGYAGAYTNEKGQSWLQQQVEKDPNFVKNSDQSQWGRDAYYHWKDQAANKQQSQLPTVNNMPMPNVPVSPQVQQQAINYATNPENGLVVKAKYQTVWLNGDPNQGADAFAKLAAGGNSQPFEFASMDQVLNGQAAWTDAPVDERKKLLADPNFYKNNEIMKLDPALQQELFKDPSFDWKQLPAWQKTYFDVSSSPAGMGAAQGALMGLGGGPVGSAVGSAAGALLGWAGGVSEYDQNKEAWQQGDNKFTWDTQQLKDIAKGAFGWMNFAAEQAEKLIGVGVQAIGAAKDPNVDLKDVLTKEGWNAGAGTFEAMAPAVVESMKQFGLLDNMLNGEMPTAEELKRIGGNALLMGLPQMIDLFNNPEKYKGTELYLGAANAVEIKQTFQEKLAESRERIANGENYRVVMSEMQTGITAQVGDMLGQAVADPLNVVGKAQSAAGEGIAKITGNSVAEAAFKGTDGITEAAAKYKTLVQTGEALKINPEFKVSEMSGLSRWAAGLNEQGQIKAGGFTAAGLLDKVDGDAEARPSLFKDPKGFVKMLASETPQSRAETGAVMFKDNVVAMLSMFDDPHETIKYLKALSNNDMDTWSQLGGRFAESPEFYTVLPALKDFNGAKLEGIIQAWDMTTVNRDYLTKVADILGDSPARVLDDLAKRGTSEQDFTRIVERLKASTDPNAKAMLADIDAGKFTVDTLAQVVDVFTGEGALPYHPAQWKAMMGAELSDHFATWAADRLALDKSPEAKSAFFRTMGVLKTAQSILLLGGSPGYAIQNGLSGMVHLAASGIYGYMTPGQIGSFLDRLGVSPARMDEGVGIGGVVDSGTSTSLRSAQDAISKAPKGTGTLTEVKQTLGKISSGMPMSKLSSWFEKLNGKQAFAQGMKQMWSQSWRRGVGFSNMRPELVKVIRDMGIDPKHIYAAIEAGMNQGEIEKALFGRFEGVQSRSLVHDAAARSGMSASQAADMLEKLGVLDQLDSYLKGQMTADGINAAFEKASQTARDQIEIRTGEDLARIADSVKQKVGLEGAASGLDVVQKAHGAFTDTWMDHYFRFGDVFESLQDITDDAMKSKAIELAYKQSDDEFRRMYARNAANYKGIFDAWGLSGDPKALKVLQAIGEADAAMKTAYDFMRAARKEHFGADWGGDIDAMFSNWDKINGQINAAFNQAFKDKHVADVKMGAGLAEIYEGLYGKAAGEAARLWWEDTVKLNDEIVAKERKARNEFANLPREQRAIAKKKYYGETKIMQIAELEKVNQAGIARLERVIKGGGAQSAEGGGQTGPVSPVDGGQLTVDGPSAALRSAQDASASNVEGQRSEAGVANVASAADVANEKPTPAQEIAELTAKAEARVEVEQVEQLAKVESVWGVAAEYVDRNGKAYDPANKYALIGALRKAEYGGDATLLGLDDPKVTPEFVRGVMEKRKAVIEAQQARAAEVVQADIVVKPRSELDPRLSEILNMEAKRIADVISGGEAGKRQFAEGQFIGATSSTYPDWYGDLQKQTGGKQKLLAALEKIQKDHGADKGVVVERVKEFLASTLKYGDPETGSPPNLVALKLMGADDVMMNDALNVFNDQFQTAFTMEQVLAESYDWGGDAYGPSTALRSAQDVSFDVRTWEDRVFKALADDDLTALYDLEGELPRELLGERNSPDGETYGDFINRTMTTVEDANRVKYRSEGVAQAKAQADEALYQQGVKADAVMTRKMLEEKFVESFGDSPKVAAYMGVFDAVVGTFAKATGESVDSFTARFYADVVKGADDGQLDGGRLNQEAFHGSPYKFDKFTLDAMGTGEGAQAYGWGLYFAGDKAVANYYRENLARSKIYVDGKEIPFSFSTVEINKSILNALGYTENADVARTILNYYLTYGSWETVRNVINEESFYATKRANDILPDIIQRVSEVQDKGQLYKVEIPDDNYLLWDKPFSEQSDIVKQALGEPYKNALDGRTIYKTFSHLNGGDKAASLALKEAGINGIQYLDGSSRGKGAGNYNYVIFDDAAIQVKETFYQRPDPSTVLRSAQDAMPVAKGAVVFDPETMKATIHAFESADMSTLIHENAHVFRRMFADVAERTGNAKIKADLATIEDWAGVKDGAWDVAAEEKFARGFERYLADGHAPTPALAGAFRTFRNWMLDIYKSITGSSLDVKLSPDVRDAFSRMMGAEKAAASTDILKTLGDEYFGEQVDTFTTMSFKSLRELGKRQGELGTKITQYMDELKNVVATLREEELYVAATPLGGNNRFDTFTSYAMDEVKARGLALDVSNGVDVSKVSEVDPELIKRVAGIEDEIARRVFGESVDLFKDIGYASGKASGKITEYEIVLRAEMKGWSEAELQAAAKTNVIREANMTTLQYVAWNELNSRRPSADGSPSTALRSAQDVGFAQDVNQPVPSSHRLFYERRRVDYIHSKSEGGYTGTAYDRAVVDPTMGAVDRNGVRLQVGDRITVDGRRDVYEGANLRGEILTNWGVFSADQVLSVAEIEGKVDNANVLYQRGLKAQSGQADMFAQPAPKQIDMFGLKPAEVFEKTTNVMPEPDGKLVDDVPVQPEMIASPKADKAQKGLTDFGEKLGGAKKDLAAARAAIEVKPLTDADLNTMPLSEIFPKSAVTAIEDPNLAALAHTLREMIPSKPRDAYKVKRWVEVVKAMRSIIDSANMRGLDEALSIGRSYRSFEGVSDKVNLLRQLPREKWSRVAEVRNYPDSYQLGERTETGYVHIPDPHAEARVDGKIIRVVNFDELTVKVQEALGMDAKAATSTMKFELRRGRGEYFINKVGDPLYRKLMTFESADDGRKFLRESQADLVKAWEDVKESDNVKETDVRRTENLPRSGKDYRKGKDATPEMFNKFGFRGVEFGNWVSQGGNLKERQGMLNAAYDGLMDLADIVHIPPEALSLNGSLGLGLGSRGSGKASAHYEPDAIVINLTKTKGAGSLAHEWFHALDNYFSRQRGKVEITQGALGNQEAYRQGNMITYKPEPLMVYEGGRYSMTEAELLRRRAEHPNNPYYAADKWSRDPKHPQGVRTEVESKFADLVNVLDESPMTQRAELIDKGKSDGYWSRIIERAARSFENYVIEKMAQDGYQNDYLANVAKLEEFKRDPGRYPYLLDEELAPVVEAFDNLFNTIETKKTEQGVALYQREERTAGAGTSPAPTEPINMGGEQPFGALDAAAGDQALFHGEVMDEGWRTQVEPLLDAMKVGALEQVSNPAARMDGMRDMSPEGQKMLRQYMKGVQNEMATSKLATMKWGESKRDEALLNYGKRYGIDRYAEVVYPYQYFYTRSLGAWAARAIDKPAWFANYARIKKQQDRYENNLPERLRGKIKISMPWMPDWMGDALYIDPLANLFTPANYLKPFERMQKDSTMQQQEADRILQEWAADGRMSQSELQAAAQNRSGAVWERALAEAGIRRESEIANPMDFLNTMFGPAWYLTTPYKLLQGEGKSVTSTPLLNTTRAIDTVTQGTWAEGAGNVIGMLGKPEEWMRKKLGLPEFGEYGDYYIDRQLSNMAAEGVLSPEDAQMAMIERSGAAFDQARERVKTELAMRVPTAAALMAGLTADNFAQGIGRVATTALPSLFGAGLLPEGELEYRGLKQEWNEAWKKADGGDKTAIPEFFDEHPEYEVYLAKGKEPEERMRSFLVGQIWDGYMELGETNQKAARAQMGELFSQAFLDKETRSYESIPVEQLAAWAGLFGKKVPEVAKVPSAALRSAQDVSNVSDVPDGLKLYDAGVTQITDQYFEQRREKFPNYYEVEQGYYNIPKSERTSYLLQHPDLKAYWSWKDSWNNAHPDLVPIFKGQVFKTVDTSGWPDALVDYVSMYAMSGERLPTGAYKALEQQWIMEGKPYGDVDTWLNAQVVPGLMYGGGQP